MDQKVYKISTHAKQRYVERILNKDDTKEVQRFIVDHGEKIDTDINKLINYGELIYQGKTSHKDGKGSAVNVYLKDCWVVLVDIKGEIVITLYKVDLGCGDDFNNTYVSKMVEKLNESKEKLAAAQTEVENESKMYKDLIDDAMAQINEYKAMINNLEKLIAGYKTITENNVVKISQANREVADIVNKLIAKKEF